MKSNFLKRVLVLATSLCLTASLASCGKDDSSSEDNSSASESSSVSDTSSQPEESSEIIPTNYEEYYEVMKHKSLVSTGYQNTMKNVIKKAQNGEEVTIAYLGGSITEGISAGPEKCYAKLSYDYFAQTFGTGENVKYVNAGLSGTPSTLGVFRLERDVLNYNPDVVFIEFAVNDGTDGSYQGAFESIIRTIKLRNPDTAIVLLFSRLENGYSAQDYMKDIGSYYNLPMISYADAITYMIDNGQLTWKEFSNDQSHPNADGHKIVCDMIAYYFDTVAAMEENTEEYNFPTIFLASDTTVNSHIVESDGLTPTSLGDWTEGTTINTFTKGWSYNGVKEEKENAPLTFKVTAKNLYLLYRENNTGNLGEVNVKITDEDGNVEETKVNGLTANGWGNPTVFLLKPSGKQQEYTVEISMAEGSEDKFFEVLGFGYTLAK